MALVLGNVLHSFEIRIWVIFLCAAVMALGTFTGGWRIIRTLGMKITKLEPHQGFAAEMAAASTITLASRLGIPLSTTHTISTAIVGVGAARGLSAVRWGITANIVTAWILTFPICAAIAWIVVKVARLF
jgi:PiT family inorganic phosphate transporter